MRGFITGAILAPSPSADTQNNESGGERRDSVIKRLLEGGSEGENGEANSTERSIIHGDDLLAGRWRFVTEDNEAQRLVVNLTMVKVDGSDFHTMLIENVPGSASNVSANVEDESGARTYGILANITARSGAGNTEDDSNGTATSASNSSTTRDQWSRVPLSITVIANNVIVIDVDDSVTDNHFRGQKIYGIVTEHETLRQ